MNLFELIASHIKQIFHLKPTTLKGAPGVSDPKATADHFNTTVEKLVDEHLPQGIQAVETALHIPTILSNAPGVTDPQAATTHVETVISSQKDAAQ